MSSKDQMENCKICEREISSRRTSGLCGHCKRLRDRVDIRNLKLKKRHDPKAREIALRSSWVAGNGQFICMYSGVPLFSLARQSRSPLYLSLDHRIPGQEDYVVTCRLINDMKGILDDDEFRHIILDLADYFRGHKEASSALHSRMTLIQKQY